MCFYNMIVMVYSIVWWGLLFYIIFKFVRCKIKSVVKISIKLSLYVFFKFFVFIFCLNGRRNFEVLLFCCVSFEVFVWFIGFIFVLWRNVVVLVIVWGILREMSWFVCWVIICGKIYLGVLRGRGIGLLLVLFDVFVCF